MILFIFPISFMFLETGTQNHLNTTNYQVQRTVNLPQLNTLSIHMRLMNQSKIEKPWKSYNLVN